MNKGNSISDFCDGRDNNFSLIRVVAAFLVIFSHSFMICDGVQGLASEPLVRLAGISLGEIAVNVFFLTSGFLVTKSLFSRDSLIAFFRARALRIFPGLFVALLFCAFVIGPLVSELSVSEYFSRRAVYSFVIRDLLLFDFVNFRYDLPGVFNSLPYPKIVNGSLWTLPWECWAYFILGLLGVFSRSLSKCLILAVSVFFLGLNGWLNLSLNNLEPTWVQIGSRFGAYFFSGALFYLFRAFVPVSFKVFVGVLMLGLILGLAGAFPVFSPLLIGYSLFVFAFLPQGAIREFNRFGDYSYGLYIYGYPVQQVLVLVFEVSNPYLLTVFATVLTLPLAWVSWHFVEKKSLRLNLSRALPVMREARIGS